MGGISCYPGIVLEPRFTTRAQLYLFFHDLDQKCLPFAIDVGTKAVVAGIDKDPEAHGGQEENINIVAVTWRIGMLSALASGYGTVRQRVTRWILLNEDGIRISMDGKGRWRDNVMIERLWRTLKYESIYPHAFETGGEVRQGLKRWIDFYNTRRRLHFSLDDRPPDEAYWQIYRPGYTGPSISLAV